MVDCFIKTIHHNEEEKQVAKYVGAEEAMEERAMEARAMRMANIPFRIPDEQIPVNLSICTWPFGS